MISIQNLKLILERILNQSFFFELENQLVIKK